VRSKILIVDDDPTVCEMIQDVLNSADMETVTHTSSQQAVTRLELEKFQAVFLDMNMPSPDGLELTRWIRASGLNRTTPIVMITGEDDRTILARAFEAGASFFLYKPVDKERLQRLVRATQASFENGLRRTRRVGLKSKVNIRFRGQELEGETINLSLEGMLIHTPKTVPIGSSVEVCLQLSKSEKPIVGVGSVVRMHGREEMGIHLGRLTLEESQRLQEYLLPLIPGT